jgi:hypothetical protein
VRPNAYGPSGHDDHVDIAPGAYDRPQAAGHDGEFYADPMSQDVVFESAPDATPF